MAEPFAIASTPRLHLTSVDDGLEHAVAAFYPQTMDQLTAGQPFVSDCRIIFAGPVTIADIRSQADVRMSFPDGRSGYHVNVPLSGTIRSRHHNNDITAGAETAAVFPPHGLSTITLWSADSHTLSVKLDRTSIERTLAEAIRRPVTTALPMAAAIDLRRGQAQTWVNLMRLLITQVDDPESLLHEPMAAMPFVETLVNGFLTLTCPDFREAHAQPLRPPAIRAAVDIIEAEARTPLTTAEIARRCHVSVRTLQEGFQRHLGTTPMAYLRSVRLERAHADLRHGDPDQDTVSMIARRWGFTNLTRFANQHRSAYGEFPAKTLRR